MAFTLGSTSANVAESGTQANTASLSFTSGNGLVALIGWRLDVGSLSSVTYDPGGANSTALTAVGTVVSPDATEGLHIYYLSNIPTTASKVVRATWSADLGGGGQMTVFELVGPDTSGMLDNSGSATGSATGTSASCTFNTNTANCAIFVIASSNGEEPAATGGYTSITMLNASNFENGEYNLDVGASGSKTPSMTVGSSSGWGIKAAAFKLGAPVVPYLIGNVSKRTEVEWRPAPFRPGIAR